MNGLADLLMAMVIVCDRMGEENVSFPLLPYLLGRVDRSVRRSQSKKTLFDFPTIVTLRIW